MAEKELIELYDELEEVETMSEAEVCERFNVDFKQEYIDILHDEIKFYETLKTFY